MKNPLIPMGAITGPMTKEEIRCMMEAYAAQGIEQYLFYARGGCTIAYMSEEWLDLCENIAGECERLGIGLWLYDEYDCPSGTCARTILADHPEYAAKGIRVNDGKIEITEENVSYIPITDLLNPDAVTEFMARTYEKLYARLSRFFGSTILGIFTDEPGLGGTLKANVETHPYTPGIENEYLEAFGMDLFEGLLANDKQTLVNYYELLGKRFRRVYIERIADWCRERGLLFTGHLLEEQSIRNADRSAGNLLNALKGFTLPGMDDIRCDIALDADTEWVTYGTILSARNQNGSLAELGAFGPCDQPLCRYLQRIRFAAMFGVDHYVLAVSGADARGSFVKNQWLHPTNYTQPHFDCYKEFGTSAKQAAELAGKEVAFEVAILYPADDAAAEISRTENEVDEKLRKLVINLTKDQYQWKFVLPGEKVPEGAFAARYDTDMETIREAVKPAVIVTEEDDSPAREILVRRYNDGTVCVLDLSEGGKARTLKMNGKSFTLYPRDLYINTCVKPSVRFIRDIDAELKLSLDRGNIHRCVFTPDCLTHTIMVKEPVKLSLYIRTFRNNTVTTLDGYEVKPVNPCRGLTKGLRELYGKTEEITLLPGEHTVSVSEYIGASENFLPCVLLNGDFTESDGALHRPIVTAHIGENLSNRIGGFAGKLTYEFEMTPDKGVYILDVDGFELCMKVYADGLLLGTQIAHPYRFELPESDGVSPMRIKIEQFTTIGPIFGKRDDVLKDIPKGRTVYRYFPGEYHNCGIKRISLLAK